MARFDPAPRLDDNRIEEAVESRGARYGRMLFVVYLALYAVYVLLTAFAPEVMQRRPLAGINLSVLYGLGLIAVAFLMALFYDWLCRPLTSDGTTAPTRADQEARS